MGIREVIINVALRFVIRTAVAAALTCSTLFLPTQVMAVCVGDCNGDGSVTVDELVLGVNIALGLAAFGECSVFDGDRSGAVEIYELVSGVNAALNGCPPTVLRRASRSSTIAISDDDAVVVMTNLDDGSVSTFSTASRERIALIPTGAEPSAVVILPDNRTAFVANRADASVVQVRNIHTGSAAVAQRIQVGSEPTGLTLSPTGERLFVAEWAEGRVSVWDTRSLELIAAIEAPENPRALLVTNDGDADDDDEILLVTEFYGEPNPDLSGCQNGNAEVCDRGRIGRVRRYSLANYGPLSPILFEPIDSGFAPAGSAPGTPTVFTSPNQLFALATQGQKAYVTSVSASPQGPVNFQANVFPVLYVADLSSGREDRGPAGTANLARLAEEAIQPAVTGNQRFFLQEIVDLDFLEGSSTAYVASRAADVLQRVNYQAEGITIGTPERRQINLAAAGGPPPCQNPIGVVTSRERLEAYVNCWITRRLAVVDLTTQVVVATVQSTPLPAADSLENRIRLGARFFFTGRGRWSRGGDGYSSCGSCHPDGLSDNITWAFAAGPRQSTSMDGSWSHGVGVQRQRIFNWSGIFDEIHDFERNTRGVSGGLGAVTTSATGQCGTLAQEQTVDVGADGLGDSVREIQDSREGICVKDWDDIDEFVKTIRPPRGRRTLDPEAVERGAALFGVGQGACVTCHGGAGWTVSRLFFQPSAEANAQLKMTPFAAPTEDPFWPTHATQISTQPARDDDTGANIGPNQVACVLRNVNTFGIPGDDSATGLIERKPDGSRAQGRGGYNVPSLYGLQVGAPYLHHGQARTLRDVLTDEKWAMHLRAGNPTFAPSSADIDDLVAFLLSIDAATPEQAVPPPFDACPFE